MTKSPRKNVPDVGIELGAACMPSELTSDRATAPGGQGCIFQLPGKVIQNWYDLLHDKINKICAPSEDSDPPWHPPSLIRVFISRMKKHWALNYLHSGDSDQTVWMLRLIWVLPGHTGHFVGFVVLQLSILQYHLTFLHPMSEPLCELHIPVWEEMEEASLYGTSSHTGHALYQCLGSCACQKIQKDLIKFYYH